MKLSETLIYGMRDGFSRFEDQGIVNLYQEITREMECLEVFKKILNTEASFRSKKAKEELKEDRKKVEPIKPKKGRGRPKTVVLKKS